MLDVDDKDRRYGFLPALGAMARGGDITAEVLTARRVLGIVERAPVSTWSRMPGGAGR